MYTYKFQWSVISSYTLLDKQQGIESFETNICTYDSAASCYYI